MTFRASVSVRVGSSNKAVNNLSCVRFSFMLRILSESHFRIIIVTKAAYLFIDFSKSNHSAACEKFAFCVFFIVLFQTSNIYRYNILN